jgi:hypothetical protein
MHMHVAAQPGDLKPPVQCSTAQHHGSETVRHTHVPERVTLLPVESVACLPAPDSTVVLGSMAGSTW